MEDYLQSLNEQQLAAVRYDGGPSLVIAGAGSGKTRVLTNKIAYLIANGYDPRRILALTFTNKAAREMRERIARLVGEELSARLWMGTFHSMFLKILHFNSDRIGFNSNFTIYDTSDTKSAIKQILKDLELDVKDYPVNSVMSVISSAKNSLISPDDYLADSDIQRRDYYAKRPRLGEIYKGYWVRCRNSNAMDFDDILFYTNILFRDNPDVLEKYQNFFQYILVDEYQDTNFSQHLVVQQLSRVHNKVCVVGDDAQSIYSFRGADIQNILRLKTYYPGLETFKLEQNYRSTQTILNVANSLIEKNRNQIPKRIFSMNAVGERIPVVKAMTDYEESFIVANKIVEMKMLESGSYNDFAILYRTNAQSRLLEECLRKRNVPYRIYGGLSFYQRKEIKDALCYFRMSVNPNDDEALRRIINYPARGIGEKTVLKVRAAAMEWNVSMWDVICEPQRFGLELNSGTARKLNGFREMIQAYIDLDTDGKDAFQVATMIYATSKILSSLYSDNTPENISRQENLSELLNAVQQFVDEAKEEGESGVSMTDFLSVVQLATDQDSGDDDDDSPRVTLMTVHAAKGLEFRNVIIVGVEDEMFPSMHSSNSLAEVEEERRLLYVAITRAQEHCLMTYATSRYINGQTHPCMPSRFLKDIDSALLELPRNPNTWAAPSQNDFEPRVRTRIVPRQQKPEGFVPVRKAVAEAAPSSGGDIDGLRVGARINHLRFGDGTVTKIEKEPDVKITVDFDNTGIKVLLLKFAKFKIIG